MPHTMPKAPTPTTPRSVHVNGFLAARKSALTPADHYATRTGETHRQHADRLRADREAAAELAAAAAAKPKRKSRAKAKPAAEE